MSLLQMSRLHAARVRGSNPIPVDAFFPFPLSPHYCFSRIQLLLQNLSGKP